MKNGKTIAAKREKPVAESERMRARKKMRARMMIKAMVVVIMLGLVAYLSVRGVGMLLDEVENRREEEQKTEEITKVEIIDETGAGVTAAMRKFVTDLEEDLTSYGYKMTRAVLPMGRMRQVNIYMEGKNGYIKVRTDRGSGVQAEDIDRMMRYLGEQDFEYIDVRTERKAYWK